jgi:ligand-binding SRPBCC domain-containing protein
VFEFFAEAANLERLTPPFLRFRILTPAPIIMGAGTSIDYQLRLYGIPIRWRTRIETFERGVSFTDVQLHGPYRQWIHRHEFLDVDGAATQMRDTVDYQLPLGPLGVLARRMFVRGSLERIFDYRHQVVSQLFGEARAPSTGALATPDERK